MDQRAEINRLRQELQQTQLRLATAEAANFPLRQHNQALQQLNLALQRDNAQLTQQLELLKAIVTTQQQQINTLQSRLDALDLTPRNPPPANPSPADPPAWVKPNKQRTTDRPPRSKRKPEHNSARKLDPTPSDTIQHALDNCPCCNRLLSGGQIARRRQVIELPPPAPVVVIEHQVIERWCGVCRRWRAPKLDLHEQVLGQGRIGLRLASLIAGLRFVGRLPLSIIRRLLAQLYSFEMSLGGLAELLQRLGAAVSSAFERLLEQARGSPVLHMDETGWREDGENGYIWELATAGELPLRIYVYDHSRSGAVLSRLLRLGEADSFKGVLISDFYAVYNEYAGVHQRCWVHLLRDLHELKQAHSTQVEVSRWAEAVKGLYAEGERFNAAAAEPSSSERLVKYQQLKRRVLELGQQYARQEGHPCQTLAKRLLRHGDELFQYVRLAGVPSENNLAERGVRPLVVSRKISGGSRSADGTAAHMKLASLIGTWLARGQNPFDELVKLLAQLAAPQTPLPQL